MNIKVGDKIKFTDKRKVFLGDDLTEGKPYTVRHVINDEAIIVYDDANDPMIITPDEIEAAVVKVEDSGESSKLAPSFLDFIQMLRELVEDEEEGRKHDEITINLKNLSRKAVIEDAKKFLEVHLKPNCYVKGKPAIAYNLFFGVKPQFHVNKEKRKVTVLMRGVGDGEVLGKAVARCAEGDVFNEHIGKAIALGRALNLNVSKFTHAPQPKEVAVGQVVVCDGRGFMGDIKTKITRMEPSLDGVFGTAFRHTHDRGWLGSKQVDILDDTEAKYE